MKHILKPALSLFTIAAVCTVLLGLVRDITLEPIESQRRKTKEVTMKAVLNEASEFREIAADGTGKTGNIDAVYEAYNGRELIGYAIELSPVGYSGEINMMVGFDKNKNIITGMRVLRHSETPGLGALAVKKKILQ